MAEVAHYHGGDGGSNPPPVELDKLIRENDRRPIDMIFDKLMEILTI